MENVYDEILTLISTNREGEYWNFKEKYHTNKANLLHDIICMANNRSDRDAYIIFGISDGFEVTGIEDDVNRKNQQNLIDFIKSKKFSAGIRPIIELRTYVLNSTEIDILIVKNSTDTPYFLIEDFGDGKRRVKANHIYTRIGDSNTNIDKSADINHIEYLWKKRFLLNRPPLEQVKQKLKEKEEWIEEEDGYYHVFNPEYKITLKYDDEAGHPEFYSYLMDNESTSYGILTIKYFETTLYSKQYVVLDGGRYITPTPSWGFIGDRWKHGQFYSYKYFLLDSIDYILHQFLYSEEDHEERAAKERLYEGILIYENEMERHLFEEYVNSNILLVENYLEKDSESNIWIDVKNELEKADIYKKLSIIKILNNLFVRYKDEISSVMKEQGIGESHIGDFFDNIPNEEYEEIKEVADKPDALDSSMKN